MEVGRAAFAKLVAVARADGAIDAEERALLERYRRRLRLRRGEVPIDGPADDAVVVPAVLAGSAPSERVHVLEMMARVALADGRLASRERRRLELVALALEVGPLQFAELLVRAEHDAERRHRARRLTLGLGAGLVVTIGLAFGLRLGADRRSDAAGAPDFKAVQREADRSVLLLRTRYDLVRGGERSRRAGWGTGFFVTEEGHLATSAHVVRPWEFPGAAAQLLSEGWSLDEDSVIVCAWQVGAAVFDPQGRVDVSTAYTTDSGSLRILRVVGATPGAAGERAGGAGAGGDLALLQAAVRAPVHPLPLCADEREVEKLDPVMVLGFPQGEQLLEGRTAQTSPSLGVVRKVEGTVLLTAPITPGNSGGPVLDARGRVIGVARGRIGGEATLGRCVLARHVRALLDG